MPEDIDRLIQDHLAGVLDAAAVATLERWLKQDRTHRERFVRAARFDADLRQLAADRQARQVAGVPSARIARPRPRRRAVASWGPWLVAATLLIGVGGWWLSHAQAPASIGVARVVAGVVRTADQREPTGELAERTRIEVTRTATLRWRDSSELELLTGSRATVVADGVTLDDGALEAAIRPHRPEAPFIIDSRHARVTVVGTRFRVTADQSSTAVTVSEGVVRVRDRLGGELALVAGQSAVARATGFDPRTLSVAPSGGVLPAGAYASIQLALAAARPGDTVLLLPGRHQRASGNQHEVLITEGGRAGAPLILRGQPGAELVSAAWNGIRLSGASWVRLEGLHLRAAPSAPVPGNGIALDQGCDQVVISGCRIEGFGGDGLAVNDSAHIEISGNLIDGCGGTSDFGSGGIAIGQPRVQPGGTAPLITISGNRILHAQTTRRNTHGDGWSGGNGIAINGTQAHPAGSATQRIRITGNLIAGNAGNGIVASQVIGVDIEGNTCHHNGRLPQHQGAEVQLGGSDCRLVRNLLVPSPGRLACALGRAPLSERSGNRVWGGKDALAAERLAASPFASAVAAEEQRVDFALLPGLGAGAAP